MRALLVLPLATALPALADDKADLAVVHRIRDGLGVQAQDIDAPPRSVDRDIGVERSRSDSQPTRFAVSPDAESRPL